MATIADSSEWSALVSHASQVKETHLRDLLSDEARCDSMRVESDGFLMDYSRQNATLETRQLLLALARKANLEEKKASMFAGEKINKTEERAVGHTILRSPKNVPLVIDCVDCNKEVHNVLDSIEDFSNRVRSGEWVGCTGKALTNVVAVGIGGSYLGPEFLYEALSSDPANSDIVNGRTLKFLANVDPVDFSRAVRGLNAETTLVVIVSKTFTTAETMLNARTIKDWLLKSMADQNPENVVRQHVVACSSAIQKTTEFGIDPKNVFGFWDWVGGRFSVHSAVGMVPLSLHFGFPLMRKFLDGAHAMDNHFLTAPLEQNLPVLLGMFGLWNSTFLGHASRAVLPYSQALLRFPAHLQQVEMESNGKYVNMEGIVVPFQTGEIVFGEPGTNGQHSFYQLMHQGRVIPAEFIGVCKSMNPVQLSGEVASHDELMSNFFAQPDALAVGKTQEECAAEGDSELLQTHKMFPGNRPSMSLLVPSLDAFCLGQLLALYEHRVAVQGFVWGINSFDQWGVQLGKVLASKARAQLVASRTENAQVSGFNSSTTGLMKHYLSKSS